MDKITEIEGLCIPLAMNDVDTDLIIPAQYLTSVTKAGYGEHCFQRLRESDNNFVLNQKKYQDGKILIAGDNFGCGSSREHAVWALKQYGIEAIIAPSFADIFHNNSGKNGLLLITFPEPMVDELREKAINKELTFKIDIIHQTIESNDNDHLEFKMDPFHHHCFIHGLDDLDYLLSHENEISVFKGEV